MAGLAEAIPALSSLFADAGGAAAAGGAAGAGVTGAADLAGAGSAFSDVLSSGALPDLAGIFANSPDILNAMGSNLTDPGMLKTILQKLATILPSQETLGQIGNLSKDLGGVTNALSPKPVPQAPTPIASKPGQSVSLSVPQLISPLNIGAPTGLQALLRAIAQRSNSSLDTAL